MITVIIPALNEEETIGRAIDPVISSIRGTVNCNSVNQKDFRHSAKICKDSVADYVIKEPDFALLKPILN